MRETDLAWLAGIIDGEGSICLSKLHSNTTRTVVVSVANTDLEILNRCQSIAGKGCRVNVKKYKDHHTQAYDWRVTSDNALSLLRSILPYLTHSVKVARANLLLDKYKEVTPRNGKYTKEMQQKKEEFVAKFYSFE